MREALFRKLLQNYHEIIEGVEQFSLKEEEQIEQLRAKVRLFDGTLLWVREIYVADHLEVYSYYWLRADDSLITGWDNAPHHSEIATFPHHKHRAGQIEASNEHNLEDVLQTIKTFYETL